MLCMGLRVYKTNNFKRKKKVIDNTKLVSYPARDKNYLADTPTRREEICCYGLYSQN